MVNGARRSHDEPVEEFDELDEFDALDALDDDFDEDEFLAAWEAAERQAAEVLVQALEDVPTVVPDAHEVAGAAADLRDAYERRYPGAVWMLQAAGIDRPDEVDDEELLLEAVAATISMVEDPGLPSEEAAAIMALELADWVGAILGLVRAGPGAPADPESLVDYADEAEEIDTSALDLDERSVTEHGFMLVLPAWYAAGVVDDPVDDANLTRLGAWLLPAAAVRAWTDQGGAPVAGDPDAGNSRPT